MLLMHHVTPTPHIIHPIEPGQRDSFSAFRGVAARVMDSTAISDAAARAGGGARAAAAGAGVGARRLCKSSGGGARDRTAPGGDVADTEVELLARQHVKVDPLLEADWTRVQSRRQLRARWGPVKATGLGNVSRRASRQTKETGGGGWARPNPQCPAGRAEST